MPREINLLPKNFRDEEKKIRAKNEGDAKETFYEPGFLKKKPSVLQTPPHVSPPKKSFFSRFSTFFQRKSKEKKEEEIKIPVLSKTLPSVARSLPTGRQASLRYAPFRMTEENIKKTEKKVQDDKKMKDGNLENTHIWHEPQDGLSKITGTDFLSTNFSAGVSSRKILATRRWKYLFYLSAIYLVIFIFSWGISWKREQTFSVRARVGKMEYDTLTNLLETENPRFEKALENALKVKLAGELLAERTDWLEMFEFLIENTVDGVHYLEFRSNGERAISLKVEASSYETFVNQLVVFDRFPKIVEHYTFGDIHAVPDESISTEKILVNINLEFSKKFLQ